MTAIKANRKSEKKKTINIKKLRRHKYEMREAWTQEDVWGLLEDDMRLHSA